MNSMAPVWDGNGSWLVMGGGGLLALVFRGVAFEFRWRDPAHRRFWDLAFTGGLTGQEGQQVQVWPAADDSS